MKTIEEVYKEFQPKLRDFGQVILAGGSVRDTLLARTPKDFDIFVLYNKDFNFKEAKETIEPILESYGTKAPLVEWHNSEPYLVATLDWHGQEVQVMVNPAQSPSELLETFDWNVCQFAYDGTYFIGDPKTVGYGKDLILNACRFPLSTLRRGFRFSERFLMKLRNEDINTICQKIIDNNKNKNMVGPSGNEPDMPSLESNVLV